VSPRRGERVGRPAAEGEWEVRFGNNAAAKGWEQLRHHAPDNVRSALEDMRTRPRARDHRHGPLRGSLKMGILGGRQMDRWQIEVTGGARVWYLIDEARRTVWIVHAGPGHPKATER
jgi:mRNA-degrading endonuclease RelE of RelBE toxin-antitoxin system